MPESPADKAMFAASQTRLPLNGITVLDLTLARAGPTAVRHFADWGANVIRIEPRRATAKMSPAAATASTSRTCTATSARSR